MVLVTAIPYTVAIVGLVAFIVGCVTFVVRPRQVRSATLIVAFGLAAVSTGGFLQAVGHNSVWPTWGAMLTLAGGLMLVIGTGLIGRLKGWAIENRPHWGWITCGLVLIGSGVILILFF